MRTAVLKRYLLFAAQLSITVGVLGYVFHIVPFAEVWGAIASASVPYVVAGLLLQMLMRAVAAVRIRIITGAHGLNLSTATIFGILQVTAFYGLVLPGALAGGAVTLAQYVRHGAGIIPAALSIALNRLLELVTVIAIGAWFWAIEQASRGQHAPIMITALATALLAVGSAVASKGSVYGALLAYLPRLSRSVLGRRFTRLTEALARTSGAFTALDGAKMIAVGGLCMAHFLLGVFGAFLFVIGLDIDLGIVTVMWMRAAVYVLMLLPISVLGLGVREAALVVLCAPYGVAAEQAVAWSLLMFAGALLAALAGGLRVGMALWSERRPATQR